MFKKTKLNRFWMLIISDIVHVSNNLVLNILAEDYQKNDCYCLKRSCLANQAFGIEMGRESYSVKQHCFFQLSSFLQLLSLSTTLLN